MTEDGRLTEDGTLLRSVVELVTDVAAEPGWWALGGGEASDELVERLAALSAVLVAGGGIPFPNAVGLPGPSGA